MFQGSHVHNQQNNTLVLYARFVVLSGLFLHDAPTTGDSHWPKRMAAPHNFLSLAQDQWWQADVAASVTMGTPR